LRKATRVTDQQRLAERLTATRFGRRFPVLLGGDCSIVLGPLLALRRRGRYGRAFLGGHADFQHPSDEPNGEVASLDLAVATGRGPDLLTDLDGLRPLVRDQDVALVGCRVLDDNDHFLGEHIRSTAITVIDLTEVRKTGTGRVLDRTLATVTSLGPGLTCDPADAVEVVLLPACRPGPSSRHLPALPV
jgi:arginase